MDYNDDAASKFAAQRIAESERVALANMLAALERRIEDDRTELPMLLSSGVHSGIKAAYADDALVERFWRVGFEHLRRHAGNESSQWIGKRIAMAIAFLALSASLAYLIKSGKLV